MNKIILLIISSILLSFYGCEFYDHSNPLDPDYKGEMPIVKNIKEVYSFKFQGYPLEKPTCLEILSSEIIYFGTNEGRIYKYSSSSLIQIQTPSKIKNINDIKLFGEDYFYIVASKENTTDSSYVLLYKDSKWTTILSVYKYSNTWTIDNQFVRFSFINPQQFFLVYQTEYDEYDPNDNSREIVYYNNGITTNYDFSEKIFDIKAFSPNQVFALGKSNIWSFDGSNWVSIQNISNYTFAKFQYIDSQSALFLGSTLFEYKNGIFKSIGISNPTSIHFLDINFGAIVQNSTTFIVYNNGGLKEYSIPDLNLSQVKLSSQDIGYAVGLGYQSDINQQKCVIVKYGDFPLER